VTILKFNEIYPLHFGNLSIWPPFLAAPMAGYTDPLYREILREAGCPYCYTEMISSKGLIQNGPNTLLLLDHSETDAPLAVQIFGEDPEEISQAIKIVRDSGVVFEAVDINMGCPARKIVSQGAGGALLKDTSRAKEIVEAAKSATSLPVSVKMRTGWDRHEDAFDFAESLVFSGADMLVIHGRTVTQGYAGTADWSVISEIASSLKVPVVGNGDIESPEQGLERLVSSRCSGVMVGRGVLGNPFFWRRLHQILDGKEPCQPTNAERIESARDHLSRAIRANGEGYALKDLKKHLSFYFKGMRGAPVARERINRASSLSDILSAIDEIASLH